jgi:hypothetical protein
MTCRVNIPVFLSPGDIICHFFILMINLTKILWQKCNKSNTFRHMYIHMQLHQCRKNMYKNTYVWTYLRYGQKLILNKVTKLHGPNNTECTIYTATCSLNIPRNRIAKCCTYLNSTYCVVYWGLGLWCRPNWIHVMFGGNPRRVGNLEGRVQGANGEQRELVYEQPGTEVDDSYHNWRVPSK